MFQCPPQTAGFPSTDYKPQTTGLSGSDVFFLWRAVMRTGVFKLPQIIEEEEVAAAAAEEEEETGAAVCFRCFLTLT